MCGSNGPSAVAGSGTAKADNAGTSIKSNSRLNHLVQCLDKPRVKGDQASAARRNFGRAPSQPALARGPASLASSRSSLDSCGYASAPAVEGSERKVRLRPATQSAPPWRSSLADSVSSERPRSSFFPRAGGASAVGVGALPPRARPGRTRITRAQMRGNTPSGSRVRYWLIRRSRWRLREVLCLPPRAPDRSPLPMRPVRSHWPSIAFNLGLCSSSCEPYPLSPKGVCLPVSTRLPRSRGSADRGAPSDDASAETPGRNVSSAGG